MQKYRLLDPIEITGFDPLGRSPIEVFSQPHFGLHVDPDFVEELRTAPAAATPATPMFLGRRELETHGLIHRAFLDFPFYTVGLLLAEFLVHQRHGGLGAWLKGSPGMTHVLPGPDGKVVGVSYLDSRNAFAVNVHRVQDHEWSPGTIILQPILAG